MRATVYAARGSFRGQRLESAQQTSESQGTLTERGLMWTIEGVNFVNGRAELHPVTEALDRLVAFLGRYVGRDVLIEGYTDSLGSDGYNHGLSQRRADTVMSYLIAHGVSAPRLTALGKGASNPVAGNHTAAGRQRNSRVEVLVQSVDRRNSGAATA